MRKDALLNRLKQIAAQSELEEMDDMRPFRVLEVILEYINDEDVNKVVDEVVM